MLLQFAAGRSGLPELDQEQARALLFECESAKERLSFETAAVIQWQGGQQIEVSRKDFEGLLAMEGVYDIFSSTIEQALKSAAGQGYSDHALSSVILIGGLGDIPSFRTIAESRFGPARLIVHHPVDCIARGAATGNIRSFPADRVRYRYAIRIWNPETAMFELRTIIRKGCPIPSNGPVNRFRIQASYDGQSRLGIPLYRLAPGGSGEEQHRELRYDLTGGIFIDDEGLPSSGHDSSVWINEKNLPLIPADPPAMRGEPRFEILFSIDASRELLISARDIRTGKQVLQNFRAGAIR
jgi:molecular chaperone DnaK